MSILKALLGSQMPDAAAGITKEQIAELLRTTPEALKAFEASYHKNILETGYDTGNLMDVAGKQARDAVADTSSGIPEALVDRIVNELLPQAEYVDWDGENLTFGTFRPETETTALATPVTNADINMLPVPMRPQLAGDLVKKDIDGPSYPALLAAYMRMKEAKTPKERQLGYHVFRQGLDILDLDPVLYAILSTNRNAMGNWLPALCDALAGTDFFKVPKTRVVRVPLPILQLSRTDYEYLTQATMAVVDRFCTKAFELDESKEYFVKTGTYSSKFDFRNAHVHGAKEVRELGEYLLYLSHQAVQMAGPLTQPSIYGVSTTNEWVVREYIPDPENDPEIYKGLPLRTEYRVFIDCDSDEVLGISPYWRPDVMKQRFGHKPDADSPHQVHDYITYCAAEPKLMERYEANKDAVLAHVKELLPTLDLQGQWSLDIMQSGDEFYIIDMALACNSALKDCVPAGLLKPDTEISLPRIPDGTDREEEKCSTT